MTPSLRYSLEVSKQRENDLLALENAKKYVEKVSRKKRRWLRHIINEKKNINIVCTKGYYEEILNKLFDGN